MALDHSETSKPSLDERIITLMPKLISFEASRSEVMTEQLQTMTLPEKRQFYLLLKRQKSIQDELTAIANETEPGVVARLKGMVRDERMTAIHSQEEAAQPEEDLDKILENELNQTA